MVKLNNPYWIKSPESSKIISALGKDNIRFVGGCVRNHLMNLPVEDIDIAAVLEPEEVMSKLKKSDITVIPTGLKHGTVTAVVNHQHFEITTLRKDVECYGRHAEVEYTDNWQEDASRRDFTVNALYADTEGNIYDYFNGLNDIKNGLIKFIGDPNERIIEDGLRILRFFRFLAFYGKNEPNKEDIDVICKLKGILKTLSGERIQKEMFRLFTSDNGLKVVKKMDELGILDEIELKITSIDKQIKIKNPIVFLSSIIDEATVLETARRWKLSNNDKKLLLTLTTKYIPADADEILLKQMVRKLGKKIFSYVCEVLWARDEISYQEKKNALELANKWKIPEFPINGSDLLNLGVPEGQKMGQILRDLETKWEKSNYSLTKKELLEEAKKGG